VRTEVKNRLIMTKALVSARKTASAADRYAWVWVAPLRDGTFRVSTVELPGRLVDEDLCFFEADIERVHVGTADDISGVDKLVKRVGVDPESLDSPWKNGFPL
jgi:hypothetical protein